MSGRFDHLCDAVDRVVGPTERCEVAPGETLESIADDFYGTPEAASYLRAVNDVADGRDPAEGSVLDVPVGSEDISRYEHRTEAKTHYNRGTLLAERGDLDRAAEEFRAALRVDPHFVDAGHNLGVVLLESGDAETERESRMPSSA